MPENILQYTPSLSLMVTNNMHTGAIVPPNPMEEMEKNRQVAERRLTKKGRRRLEKERKQGMRKTEQRKGTTQKLISIAAIVAIGGGGLFALGWFLLRSPLLPPTVMTNHVEQSPPSHIMTIPIPDKIQRHMLEHADGGGRPGVIIQYNCQKYGCESSLVQKLTELAGDYPDYVYLAPNNYDGKIILTKLGRREILDEFDEQRIIDFIE